MSAPRLVLALAAALSLACNNPGLDPSRPESPTLQVVQGGNGFYFLKPTVTSAPERFPGAFDPNRRPMVTITCIGATHEGCPVLATFDRTANGGVHIEMERYQADWNAPRNLRLGKGNYRLEVRDGPTLLGWGDLWVVSSSSGLKEVTPDHLGVVRGTTFPIRFRIETLAGGVVDTVIVTPDSTNLPPGGLVQLIATPRDASGNPVGGQPVWTSSDPAVAAVSAAGLVTGVAGGRAIVTAAIGGQTGGAVILVGDQLPGQASDPVASVIPRAVPAVNLAEYDKAHPRLPGFLMSFTTAILTTTPSATVGEINAILTRFGGRILGGYPGVAGKAGGNLVVRFPSANHVEMDAILAQVVGRPGIAAAVADHTVGPTIAPANNATIGWIWSLLPSDDNWGMEAIRTPALWNFNDYVRKSGRRTTTGVFDVGFTTQHPDLVISRNQAPTLFNDHGVHVAGIVGATFDNGVGVDGVNPFADLDLFGVGSSTWAQVLVSFCTFLVGSPAPTVVNVSLGYNWHLAALDTRTDPGPRQVASDGGLSVVACLAAVATLQSLPYVVAAAGNDDGQDARWASPWNAAALIHGMAPIIVVEAAAKALAPQRASFSNVNGHVSAPGEEIKSTANSVPYLTLPGTSMAAPHVAGLVGYLTALAPGLGAPTLNNNPLLTLLHQTGQLSTDPLSPRIDAFAAALELDRQLGGNQILRALADFDDGSSDGNRRVDAAGVIDTNEDHDGDGGRGDGRVDMSDFRRFRDWLLDAEQAPGLSLDGPQNTGKRDQNGDGQYPSNTSITEGTYSRGDLNGDGTIHRTATAVVGGVIGRAATDLDVLMAAFSDPVYSAFELPGLLQSGDITVNAGACIDAVNAARVDLAVQVTADTTRVVRRHAMSAAGRTIVFTVPTDPAGYTIRLALLDAAGAVLRTEGGTSGPVGLGSDAHFRPTCLSQVAFGPISFPPGAIGVAYSVQLAGTGGDGTYAYSVVSGMPPGLSLLGDRVTGTPTQAGNFQLTLRITSAGHSATATFAIGISAGANQDPLLAPGNTPSSWQMTFSHGQCCGSVSLARGTLGPGRYQLLVGGNITCFLVLPTPVSLPSSFTGTCDNGFQQQTISGNIGLNSGSGVVGVRQTPTTFVGNFTLTRL